MSQPPLKTTEERGAAQKQGPEVQGMHISLNSEYVGNEQSLGPGGNSSSDARLEKLLLVLKLNEAKLENEELRSTVMQKEVALKAMTKTILELEKRVKSLQIEKNFCCRRMTKCYSKHVR